ncbi:MAG: hypothetical protein AB8B72_07330 [Crocinitomicaceae bacterium]
MILRKILLVTILFQFSLCFGQSPKVDLDQFLAETQISSGGTEEVKIIWWIPVEFWSVALADDKSLTETQKEDMLNSLSEIFLVGVVHGSMDAGINMEYESYKAIKKSLVVTGQNGEKYKPLNDGDISVEVEVLLAAFKPVLKSLIGNMGENFHFYVFSDNVDGKRIADPLAGGKVDFKLFSEHHEVKTPLGSLLPKKICPVDDEPMNGGWKYCPHHGEALVEED